MGASAAEPPTPLACLLWPASLMSMFPGPFDLAFNYQPLPRRTTPSPPRPPAHAGRIVQKPHQSWQPELGAVALLSPLGAKRTFSVVFWAGWGRARLSGVTRAPPRPNVGDAAASEREPHSSITWAGSERRGTCPLRGLRWPVPALGPGAGCVAGLPVTGSRNASSSGHPCLL